MSDKVSMDANDFPFDHGVVVSSGGYRHSLLNWRQYYTNNVLFTKAITHEGFCAEFPEAAAALAESDVKTERFREMRERMGGMSLMEVMAQFAMPKHVKITADTVREAEGDAPAAQMKDHVHMMPEGGEGETSEAEGHTHPCRGGVCMEAMGHNHEAPDAAKAPEPEQED